MELEKLKQYFEKYPKYRLEQAKRAVFVDLIRNWNEALTLPEELRKELNEKCPLDITAEAFKSKDGKTTKALVKLADGLAIETVLMQYESNSIRQSFSGRNTVCISSQIGCALGCDFCATGKMGFKRSLTAGEIIVQILFWARFLKEKNDKITNVVFMGMGEPFLNYENVLESIRILNDQKGFNLGARHFSISTSGVIEGINKLAQELLQINLAISLHSPDDELRSRLMPINKKYPIKKILKAVDDYIKKTNRKVMFEYIMIDGINDSDKQAQELAKLMKKPLYFVNLIPCNLVGGFRPSPQKQIEKFKKILTDYGVAVNQRYSFGQDIYAACGQLACKNS